MKKLTLVISSLLVFSLVLSIALFTTEAESGFSDVSGRYKEAVDHVVEQQYALGLTSSKFGTADEIKRLDAAVMVAKVMGFSPSTKNPDSGFSDVPKDRAWAVDALKHAGVIDGKTTRSYGSYDTMTRSEMAKVLASAYDLSAKSDAIPFTDVNTRFKTYVAALVESEIAFGKTETQFGAGDNITRGEFALFVFRADQILKNTTPPEVISVD